MVLYTNSDFLEVFKAFLLLLNRLGPKLWEGGQETSAIVFNSIKDNPKFMETLRTTKYTAGTWLLKWIEPFIKSLEPPGLCATLPLVIQFLCEEVQHEMYGAMRPVALLIAASVSIATVTSVGWRTDVRHRYCMWV